MIAVASASHPDPSEGKITSSGAPRSIALAAGNSNEMPITVSPAAAILQGSSPNGCSSRCSGAARP